MRPLPQRYMVALFPEMLMVKNVVRAEAVIALTLGAVAEFQLRVVGVRAAADLAFVAVAPLRFRPLLLPDSGLESDGLPGALPALDAQCTADILPKENDEIQKRHHSGQRTGNIP